MDTCLVEIRRRLPRRMPSRPPRRLGYAGPRPASPPVAGRGRSLIDSERSRGPQAPRLLPGPPKAAKGGRRDGSSLIHSEARRPVPPWAARGRFRVEGPAMEAGRLPAELGAPVGPSGRALSEAAADRVSACTEGRLVFVCARACACVRVRALVCRCMCMCVCVCVCVCVSPFARSLAPPAPSPPDPSPPSLTASLCPFLYVCARPHARTHARTHACTRTCINTCTSTHPPTHTYTCTHPTHARTHMHTRTYAHTHTHIRTHTNTRTHTHTHLHTHPHTRARARAHTHTAGRTGWTRRS